MKITIAAGFLLCGAAVAFAQSHYSGMESREIKNLSSQQIADLKAGRGMGMALAAELNGYPGPMHVLELAEQLELSTDQRAKVQGLFDAMKTEAVPNGEKLIGLEADLNRQFALRQISSASLQATTAAIAEAQGKLRETHLKYHLTTAALLTDAQRQRYAQLRGYRSDAPNRHH